MANSDNSVPADVALEPKKKLSAAKLRAKALNAVSARAARKLELEGDVYMIAVPTVAEVSAIQAAAMEIEPQKNGKPKVKVDQGLQKALAALKLVRDEDGVPVFEETDQAAFLAAPAGGLLDKLGEAAVAALNVDEEALEGN
jgi:hypothetical protein